MRNSLQINGNSKLTSLSAPDKYMLVHHNCADGCVNFRKVYDNQLFFSKIKERKFGSESNNTDLIFKNKIVEGNTVNFKLFLKNFELLLILQGMYV